MKLYSAKTAFWLLVAFAGISSTSFFVNDTVQKLTYFFEVSETEEEKLRFPDSPNTVENEEDGKGYWFSSNAYAYSKRPSFFVRNYQSSNDERLLSGYSSRSPPA